MRCLAPNQLNKRNVLLVKENLKSFEFTYFEWIFNFGLHVESFAYLRVMSCAVSACDRLEAIDADLVEPGVDLLVEVRGRVSRFGWRASGPSGCEVLPYREAADVALRRAVVRGHALVGPTLRGRCQLIIPYL